MFVVVASGNLLWSRLIGHNQNRTTNNTNNPNKVNKNQKNKKNRTSHAVQEYDLILQHDLFTAGNVQWFYYRVGNTRKHSIVKFNLINMKKSGSLFGLDKDGGGMQPCVYSQMDAKTKGIGWHRACTDVRYYHNSQNYQTNNNNYQKKQSTLSFVYQFQHDDDCVFFAMCHPYTYTDMQEDIASIRSDPERSKHVVFQSLCNSIGENRIDKLTITSRSAAPLSMNGKHLTALERMRKERDKKPKRAIVLSSRVHPGETNASWMMRGVLDFLTGESIEAQGLREHIVIKIVPMLNPDGVINGNYRCNLSGKDLNRKWSTPSKWEQPSIHGMRSMFDKMIRDGRNIALFCDMHGHSRKKNVFTYGCLRKKGHPSRDQRPLKFPYILSNVSHPFSFMDSRFKVQRSKSGTGRVVGWRGHDISLR
jgi:hypothetical protein